MSKKQFVCLCFLISAVVLWKTPQVSTIYAQNAAVVTSLADLAGNNAAQQIATVGVGYWVQITAPSTNLSVARCGDVNVSATRGNYIAAGAGQMYPPVGYAYNLSSIYCYVATGDKVTLTYAH